MYKLNFFYEPVNQTQWNFFEKVNKVGYEETFLATNRMKKGDILFLHVGSQDSNYDSGIYAVAKVISDIYTYMDDKKAKCYNRKFVDTVLVNYVKDKPYISHADAKKYINQFRTVHMLNYDKDLNLLDIIQTFENDNSDNKYDFIYTKYWFVNLEKYYKEQRNCSFLWAPLKNEKGKSLSHWDALGNVGKRLLWGHCIFQQSW
jgi:hypothetical protein